MSRYPRRKRGTVSYAVDDSDEGASTVYEGEADENWRPRKKKARKSSTAKMRRNRPKKNYFPLMELPGELRNKVYEHLLCLPDNEIYIGDQWSKEASRKQAIYGCKKYAWYTSGDFSLTTYRQHLRTTVTNFGILRTCKAVHAEAMGILYGQKFRFGDIDAMQTFLLRLSPATIARLRHVDCFRFIVQTAWKYAPAIFSLLRPATGLEYLRIEGISKFRGHFDDKVGTEPHGHNMSVQGWDILVARNMAREVYTHMYPYMQVAVREKGAAGIMKILHVFGKALDEGPTRGNYGTDALRYSEAQLRAPSNRIYTAPWTPARASAMRAAMGEELARLAARDAI
ncbi:hypothetical protein SLS53_008401 [Cytospora paraplurivora]|uniref:DUF7730 domain-containing protein n=1 Tax=Cytospora paraplurivora TaxID=2898453 RepID=A0AAN9TXP6_9PEZI